MFSVVTTSDPALASALRLSVMRLARRLRAERSDSALTLGQLSVLACLDRNGSLTPGELATHERVRPPQMTRLVASLDETGLLVRTDHPTDRRAVLVSLSPEGVALVREDRRRRDAWLAQQLQALSEQDREVLRAAAEVLERLGAA